MMIVYCVMLYIMVCNYNFPLPSCLRSGRVNKIVCLSSAFLWIGLALYVDSYYAEIIRDNDNPNQR